MRRSELYEDGRIAHGGPLGMPLPPVEDVAAWFDRFARVEGPHMSPFYAALAAGVAEDREVLEVARRSRPRQPVANLLFGAVRLLLDRGDDDALLALYPDGPGAQVTAGAYDAFRCFVLANRDPIVEIVSTRSVQSNGVRRAAVLLLGLHAVSEAVGAPFVNVEIGASAGLTLLWERFQYDYGEGRALGDLSSTVKLRSALEGQLHFLKKSTWPKVTENIGIEIDPVDLDDPGSTAWLNALIWPEHLDNRELSEAAVQIARHDPPRVIAGDALEVLPGLIAGLPDSRPVSIYHSHTLNQFSTADREKLDELLREASASRQVLRLSFENVGEHSALSLVEYRDGRSRPGRHLADCEPHGRWIRWTG